MKGFLVAITLILCIPYVQAQNREWTGITFEKSEASKKRTHAQQAGLPNVVLGEIPMFTTLRNAKGFGLGVSYERFFTRRGLLSIVVPFYFSTPIQLGFHKTGSQWQVSSTQFFAPGVRFHPLGNGRDADLSIGLQCAAGGYAIKNMMVTSFGTREMSQINSSLFTLLAEANINLYPGDHIVVGFRVAYGRLTSEYELIQVGFKVGGRF